MEAQNPLFAKLPQALRRFVDSSVPTSSRKPAAKGLIPLPPKDLVIVVAAMCFDPNKSLRREAAKTLSGFPEVIVLHALRDPLPAEVIACIAELCARNVRCIEAVILNKATSDATVERIAKTASSQVIELISTNEGRLTRHPGIIKAILLNPATPREVENRVIEMAGRRGVSMAELLGQIEAPAAPRVKPSSSGFDRDERTDEWSRPPERTPVETEPYRWKEEAVASVEEIASPLEEAPFPQAEEIIEERPEDLGGVIPQAEPVEEEAAAEEVEEIDYVIPRDETEEIIEDTPEAPIEFKPGAAKKSQAEARKVVWREEEEIKEDILPSAPQAKRQAKAAAPGEDASEAAIPQADIEMIEGDDADIISPFEPSRTQKATDGQEHLLPLKQQEEMIEDEGARPDDADVISSFEPEKFKTSGKATLGAIPEQQPEIATEEKPADDDDVLEFPQYLVDDKAEISEDERKNITTMLSTMTVMDKVKLARLGSKEVRAILVRDSNKIIATTAAESPKLTEQEAISYASSRSVCDDVIRIIANHKEWSKIYQVKASLVNNPKTPLHFGLRIIQSLNMSDLKSLTTNRSVNPALGATATKLLKMRVAERSGTAAKKK